MIGDFDFLSDNLMSAIFCCSIGYIWVGFLCKRLMMEEDFCEKT